MSSSRILKTRLLDDIDEAAHLLRTGRLVAFPTETVFGLGADARDASAIERLFVAKGRPSDNPLIVHLANRAAWPLAASTLPPLAEEILKCFAPGPVTVVIPKNNAICPRVTAGLETVGIRIPAAAVTQRLLAAAAIPIAAPSANLSGRPSGTTWQSVLEDLDGRIDGILCMQVEHVGLESTVIDCCGTVPVVLRLGGVGLTVLRAAFPAVRLLGEGQMTELPESFVAKSTSSVIAEAQLVNSPGLRHPHYQPRAQVRLLDAVWAWSRDQDERQKIFAYAGLAAPPAGVELSQQYTSWEDFAREFYEFLRVADRAQADVVLIQAVTSADAAQSGIAAALRDRQQRAAGRL